MPRRPRHVDATGNRDARFAEVVRSFESPLSRYLVRMVGDAEVARDLAQETFLSAYAAWPEPEPAHLSAWLYRIATNHALSHLRRRRVIRWVPFSQLASRAGNDTDEPRTDDLDHLFPNEASPADGIIEADTIAAILDAMDSRDRAALLLHAAGFSGAEIGDQLNCSPPTARTRLSRARAQFREQYTRLAALNRPNQSPGGAGESGEPRTESAPLAAVVPHHALLARRAARRRATTQDAPKRLDDDAGPSMHTGGSNA